MNPLNEIIRQQGFAVLDGALATELERHGADLADPLWSARCLIEAPERIARVHRDYLEAGADVIGSATYQASEEGFTRRGLSRDEARHLLQEGIRLAVRERDAFWAEERNREGRQKPLVAASMGPFGAILHDGSEYHGNYEASWHEVEDFHRRRTEVIAQAGADLLAFETIPSLPEAECIARVLEASPRGRAWISFSARDDAQVSHGESFTDCVAALAGHPAITALGINCTAPQHVLGLLESAKAAEVPLLVYPNSGETWVAAENRWIGRCEAGFDIAAWYRAGARAFGGCCRTSPAEIHKIRAELRSLATQDLD